MGNSCCGAPPPATRGLPEKGPPAQQLTTVPGHRVDDTTFHGINPQYRERGATALQAALQRMQLAKLVHGRLCAEVMALEPPAQVGPDMLEAVGRLVLGLSVDLRGEEIQQQVIPRRTDPETERSQCVFRPLDICGDTQPLWDPQGLCVLSSYRTVCMSRPVRCATATTTERIGRAARQGGPGHGHRHPGLRLWVRRWHGCRLRKAHLQR
jgi:hypothetical protein